MIPLNDVILTTTINTEWQKCLGGSNVDAAYSSQRTADGGYIIAGGAYSNDGDVSGNHGQYDYWVVKLNSTGVLQWKKCLGGNLNDYAFNTLQTTDGGYIIAGYSFSNNGNVTGNHGNADCWLVKLDSTGILQWQKCLGGGSDDYASSIMQTTDGGYIVAGYTNSNDGDVSGNHGSNDYWVVKLDGTGILQWQKCLGGGSDDYASSVKQTTDGGYIVAGYTNSNDGNVSANHGSHDYWVIKLDSAGVLQWQKCLGGGSDDYASSVQQTADNGYIVAGYTNSNDGDVSGNHGSYDCWVVKLDSAGVLQWQKCLGGSGYDGVLGIQQMANSGYTFAGYTNSNDGDVSGNHGSYDCWVVKLDSAGLMQWQKCLGGSSDDYATSFQQTADSGYIVAGYTNSNDGDVSGNQGDIDYWIVKTTSVEESPNTPSVPSGPNSGYISITYNYSTSATDPNNDRVKYVFDWGDGTTSETNLVNSGASASASHAWSDAMTYQVKARAIDEKGESSGWSEALTVIISKPNSPPGQPSVSGPVSGATGLSYSYAANASDPDGDRMKYTFDWGDGTTSVTDWVNSSQSAQVSHAWTTGGTYLVKAIATDIKGANSSWSASLTVTISSPPNTPGTPVGTSVGVSQTSYTYYTSATDPSGLQVKYTFDWGDGTTSTTSLVNSGVAASASHRWDKAGSYQVRAMATNSKGISSSWSSARVVKIT